jgi:hypothetical protein
MQSWKSGPAPGRSFSARVAQLSRRTRRLIVVVAYLALPEAMVMFWLHGGVPAKPDAYFGFSSSELLPLLQAGVAGAVLEQGWRASIGPMGLDERQRQLRDTAAYLSHRIVVVAVVAVTVMLYVAPIVVLLLFPFGSWGGITLDLTSIIALAFGVAVLCLCLNMLPMAVMAWLEPNPPAEV